MTKAELSGNCAVCGERYPADEEIGFSNGAPRHLKACTPANFGADAPTWVPDDTRPVGAQGRLYGPKSGPSI